MQKRYALLILLLTVPFSAAACDSQMPTERLIGMLKKSGSYWLGRSIDWQELVAKQGSAATWFCQALDGSSPEGISYPGNNFCLYAWAYSRVYKAYRTARAGSFDINVEGGNVRVHADITMLRVIESIERKQEADEIEKDCKDLGIIKTKDAHTSCTVTYIPGSFSYDEVEKKVRGQVNEVCDTTLPVAEFLAKINSISV